MPHRAVDSAEIVNDVDAPAFATAKVFLDHYLHDGAALNILKWGAISGRLPKLALNATFRRTGITSRRSSFYTRKLSKDKLSLRQFEIRGKQMKR
jgi:hypothetical protein